MLNFNTLRPPVRPIETTIREYSNSPKVQHTHLTTREQTVDSGGKRVTTERTVCKRTKLDVEV